MAGLPIKGPLIKLTSPQMTIYKENALENLFGYCSAITNTKGVWMKHLRHPSTADIATTQA